MQHGKKLSPADAQKYASALASEMAPAERVVFVGTCANMIPDATRIVITTDRFLGAKGRLLPSVTLELRLRDITTCQPGPKADQLVVASGGKLWKLKRVPADDALTISRLVDQAKTSGPSAAEQAAAAELEQWGRAQSWTFGRYGVTVFAKGYIAFGDGPRQQLLGIDFSDDSTTATSQIDPFNRTNRDGSVHLTVTTDEGVVTLEATETLGGAILNDLFANDHQGWHRAAVQAGRAIAAAGRAAIATAQRDQPTPAMDSAAPATATDLAGQLAQLARLKDAGALSEEEFAAAKTRLLSC